MPLRPPQATLARNLSIVFVPFVLLTFAVAALKSAHAGEALNSHDFESPYYTAPLPLLGQAGWLTANDGPTPSIALLQTGVGIGGSQAVKVDRAANASTRWAVPLADVPSGRYALIDWQMKVTRAVQDASFGPFFGVEAYDGAGTFGVLGALGADASTGDVLYQIQGSGQIVETAESISFGTWHRFQMLLDFNTNTYRMFFDGFYLASSGFVDGAFDDLTDADIATFASAGDSGSRAKVGTAYYDNFRIFDGVPGDFNNDLLVDASDLAIWQSAYSMNANADADGDFDSDGADFLVWQRHYGLNLTVPALGTLQVPEPVCGLILGQLLLMVVFVRISNV